MRHIIKKILKEETNKFELVKNLIYIMFDNVTFLEYVTKRNEIIVYYQGSSDLAPYEICNTISKYTGLYVVPWYEYGTKKYGTKNNNEPDFYIDTEKYEEELNENFIPESKETTNEVERNLEVINLILSEISWNGLCEIWVEYNEDDKEYEIRSKSKLQDEPSPLDEIQKELDFLDDSIRSMGIRPYIFTPWYVEECEDEVEFLNESEEEKNYIPIIKELVEPFKNEDCVCEINVLYDEEDDDMYSVYLVLGAEELNDKFFNFDANVTYRNKLVREIKTEIESYLPIQNIYVGSYGIPNCGWKPLNESKEESTKELIMSVLNTLVLTQYEHVICGFELKNVDDKSLNNVINYPSVTVTFIGGKGTKLYPQTPGIQKMYDDVLDDIWQTVWDYTGISVELYSKYVKDCGKENIYLR